MRNFREATRGRFTHIFQNTIEASHVQISYLGILARRKNGLILLQDTPHIQQRCSQCVHPLVIAFVIIIVNGKEGKRGWSQSVAHTPHPQIESKYASIFGQQLNLALPPSVWWNWQIQYNCAVHLPLYHSRNLKFTNVCCVISSKQFKLLLQMCLFCKP